MTKIVFPTDEHHPYADMGSLKVAMLITKDFEPDVRITGSDGVDFYALSKFNKDPSRMKAGGLQNEIDTWQRAQRAWLDASPNADVIYIIGNHEDRLRRWLWSNPELHGLEALRLENLFDFEKYHITMGDDQGQEAVFHNQLLITHGTIVRPQGGYSAMGELRKEAYGINMLTGHTHRGGQVFRTTRKGVVAAAEGFCLCSTDPEYVRNPNWQNGLVLATVDEKGVSFELIPFYEIRGKKAAVWRGNEYRE